MPRSASSWAHSSRPRSRRWCCGPATASTAASRSRDRRPRPRRHPGRLPGGRVDPGARFLMVEAPRREDLDGVPGSLVGQGRCRPSEPVSLTRTDHAVRCQHARRADGRGLPSVVRSTPTRSRPPACLRNTVSPGSSSPTTTARVGPARLAGRAVPGSRLRAGRPVAGAGARRVDGRPRRRRPRRQVGGRPHPRRRTPELAVVNADDTIVEVAAIMARLRCPLAAVVSGDRMIGVITASRLLQTALCRYRTDA